MSNYASIKFRILRAATDQSNIVPAFGLTMQYKNALGEPHSALIAELPVQLRYEAGEFTAGTSAGLTKSNLIDAIGLDYIGNPPTLPEIALLPIAIAPAELDTFIITATDYGVTFTPDAPITNSWYEVVEIIQETPPVPEDLTVTVTAQTADGTDKCNNVRFNLAFDNATYPVVVTSPVDKTINNAGEAYFDFLRGAQFNIRLQATDADNKELDKAMPWADKWTIQAPMVAEQSPGFTVTAQISLFTGSITGTRSFKLNDGQWRATPIFYNVGIGNHIIYVKDDWGCEQSLPFQAGEPELRKIYFADKGQRCERTARITNPLHTPERINIHVVFPALSKEIKRELPPIEIEPGVYEVVFDLNNLLSGELDDYLRDKERFKFPAESGNHIVDRTNLMLEFYTDESYSYIDDTGTLVPSGRVDNSGNTHHYAHSGGVNDEMQGYLTDLDLSFDQYLKSKAQLMWLSNMPNNLPVHPNQPVRLWFLNNNAMANMSLKAIATYTDGTNTGIQQREVEALSFGLFELCVGVDELLLSSINISKKIATYKVWLEGYNGAYPISSTQQTFVVDHSNYERNDFLFWRTSLGVHEALWCHGRSAEQVNVKGSSSLRPLATPSLRQGTLQSSRGNYTHPYSMNTGWFPKSLRHYLIDFVSAGEAVLPLNFFLRPVLIGDGKFKMGEDDEDLFAIAFTMQIAHNNHHYTKLPEVESPWGQFSDSFNESFYI